MKKSAIIIGAGIAGIASAIRLAKKNIRVTVFEGNNYPGGKLTEFELGDYRFDAGPSLFTLPQEVEELFRLCAENPKEKFKYTKLKATCKYFFPDNTTLTAWSDREALKKEFEEKLGEPAINIETALDKSKFLYKRIESTVYAQITA